MRFVPIFLSLSALAAARCGTNPVSEDQKAVFKELQDKEAREAHSPAARDVFNVAIDTYVHIVNGNTTTDHAKIPERVHQQIDVLNEKFDPTGFSFNLVDVTYNNNQSWMGIVGGSPEELDMKKSLRRGNFTSLNLYYVDLADDVYGLSTMPTEKGPNQFDLDGAMCKLTTLFGGEEPFDLGIMAVHEIAHWIGLLHTFEPQDKHDESPTAGCFGHGDYIKDTPAEGTGARGCPSFRDTCTGANETMNSFSIPGPDPVHNFMDWTDDRCATHFTAGQVVRLQNFWEKRENYTPA